MRSGTQQKEESGRCRELQSTKSEKATPDLNKSKSNLLAFSELMLRMGLGVMFLAAAASKLQYPGSFLQEVYAFELVGPRLGLAVSVFVPFLEALIALSLLSGQLVSGALVLSMCVLLVIIAAQVTVVYRGIEAFVTHSVLAGGGRVQVSHTTLARTFLIFAVAVCSSYLHFRASMNLNDPPSILEE